MQFKAVLASRGSFVFGCLAVLSTSLFAQSSIPLFGPVNVRLSATGTGFGSNAVVFNSTTLNLTCSASPITAVVSSSPDGTGNVLVDNYINLTVTSGQTVTGPTNICGAGESAAPAGVNTPSCFTSGYGSLAGPGLITGQDPDNYVAVGGVAPIDISQSLLPGAEQLKIDLVDEGYGTGFYLTSSTLYLNTNCTQGGVTGPALVSGNPIPASNPTPQQLAQDFPFNNIPNQQIGFTYDLSEAQAASTLTISDGTIPQVGDSPIDPAVYQPIYVPGTSFATSSCLVHSGELLPNGQAACKLFTLECKVGTGSNATGAQCPVSSQNNELFQDAFNGPTFTLPDIPTPNGPTFHQGIGFLMASEGWTGGPCSYDPASNLQSLPCPQNLLTSFASGIEDSASARKAKLAGAKAASALSIQVKAATTTPAAGSSSYTSSGRTTHPNSTFLTIAQVPEDLTTITVANQQPGYWINNSTANFTLSSQPPDLSGTTLPGAANFVASPILAITYGISPAASVPAPGTVGLQDEVLSSGVVCPTQANPSGQAATTFAPGQQSFTGLADGYYLLHYYAQDCAGTEELKFTQDGGGNWSTSFYTYPINVDTTAPVVSTPVLSPAPSPAGYVVGQAVSASFNCTDALSGVVLCGTQAFPAGTASTGTLTLPVDTSLPGSKVFTVPVTDAAGNQSSASVSYLVVSPYDSQIQFNLSPTTVNYPQGSNIVITITPPASNTAMRVLKPVKGHTTNSSTVPTGTVQILDGVKKLATLRLQGNGSAYYYLQGLDAGVHSLSISYSGDSNNPPGVSAPVAFTVQPAPVNLGLSCWNASFAFGADYICGTYASSAAGPPQGTITYTYDGGLPKKVQLLWGIALFNISNPTVGSHTVSVSYAAQTNYAAAGPKTSSFTVTPAPVNVSLTPSSWYLTAGNLTLAVSVDSWSAGAPHSTGSITFSDDSTVLSVVPVNTTGRASLTIAASTLTNGTHSFKASYSGGTDYGTGSATASVSVAHR